MESTARIRTWDAVTNELEIYNITGTFGKEKQLQDHLQVHHT